jgi:hypothetical protein
MTTHSLDSVLADAEASDLDIAEELPVNDTEQPEEAEQEQPHENGQGHDDAHGALHAERNRVKRKYTETVADFERRLNETNSGFEKKLTESLAENDRKWEQRFNQFAQQIQPRQPEKAEEPAPRPDVFENPDGFLEHGVRAAIDPVESKVSKIIETFSMRDAVREHGRERVQGAFQALHQAALSGDPEARATVERVKQSMDPFGDIVSWHQKSSVLREVGADPAAFIQKKLDEALNDPAFLQKALEKAQGGKVPAPKTATTPAIPSLNRVTAAADENEDEEDAGEVFNTALRSGVRR